jgi:hypothetical protein
MVRVEYIKNLERLIIKDTHCSVTCPKASVLDNIRRNGVRKFKLGGPREIYEITPVHAVLVEVALHSLRKEVPDPIVLSGNVLEPLSAAVKTAHEILHQLRVHYHAVLSASGVKIKITLSEERWSKTTDLKYVSKGVTTRVKIRHHSEYVISSDNILTFINDPFGLHTAFNAGRLTGIEVFQNGAAVILAIPDKIWDFEVPDYIDNVLRHAAKGIGFRTLAALAPE